MRNSIALIAALGFSACSHARPAGTEALIPQRLKVQGDADFRGKALSALKRIGQTGAGRRLYAELARTGRSVTLRYGHQDVFGAFNIPIGDGDSVIAWDPDYGVPSFPAFLGLHHELVHALYEAQGKALAGDDEELRAIGAGKFSSSDTSENAARRELGLPLRKEHDTAEEWAKAHEGLSTGDVHAQYGR